MYTHLPAESEEQEKPVGKVACFLIELGVDGKWIKRKTYIVQTTCCLYYTVCWLPSVIDNQKVANKYVSLPGYLVSKVIKVTNDGQVFLKIVCHDLRVLHLMYVFPSLAV